VREVVDWDRQDILVCCVISIYRGRVDVLIQIFVLSSIGHLDDRARNVFVCGVHKSRWSNSWAEGLWNVDKLRDKE
jgi:hypothetical protein